MNPNPRSAPPLTMYTATGCADCRLARSVLDGARVHYQEINIDLEPEAVEEVLAINGGYRTVPTIVFPDGRVLIELARQELLSALGSTSPGP